MHANLQNLSKLLNVKQKSLFMKNSEEKSIGIPEGKDFRGTFRTQSNG